MKKTITLLGCTAVMLLASDAFGTVHTIEATGMVFSPNSLTIELGDTILFRWKDGVHDTKSGSIPAGAAGWHEPLTEASPEFMYIPTELGTYNYVCTPHEAMGMVGSFTVESPSGIHDISLNQYFDLHPNPAYNLLNVSTGIQAELIRISFTDMLGRTVRNIPVQGIKSENMQLDISGMGSGVYFIRIDTDKGIVNKKVVIKN